MIISAAILAGGKATRLNGFKKYDILVGSERIIDIQLKVLNEIFDEIFFISNEKNSDINLSVYADIYNGIGPLAGIHAALTYAKTPYVFIVSCDMPFIRKDFITSLISEIDFYPAEVIVPRHKKGLEPLHAIYHVSILPVIEKQIDNKDFKIQNLYKNFITTMVDISDEYNTDKMFFNINNPEDLIKAEEYAKQI